MSKCENIRLEIVDNGFVLKYTEREKSGEQTYAPMMEESKTMVFKSDEGEKALQEMKKLQKNGDK